MATKMSFAKARQFYATYDLLSVDGWCDDVNGMECKRVYREWKQAGMPEPHSHFIRVHANWTPSGGYPEIRMN